MAAGQGPAVQASVSFSGLVDKTMRRNNMAVPGGAGLGAHKSVGRGLVKWIGRAVGTQGLKHKTELEDLPAYNLRVGFTKNPTSFVFRSFTGSTDRAVDTIWDPVRAVGTPALWHKT